MKRSYYIIGLFACLLGIILLSSFIVLDLNVSQKPVIPQAFGWIDDHKVMAALAVSESAGLLSKKVRGIVHGVLVFSKMLLSFFNHKSAQASKN
jgi:hypothetical protein